MRRRCADHRRAWGTVLQAAAIAALGTLLRFILTPLPEPPAAAIGAEKITGPVTIHEPPATPTRTRSRRHDTDAPHPRSSRAGMDDFRHRLGATRSDGRRDCCALWHNSRMPSTHEVDDMLARARMEPGVADVMRIYKHSQEPMKLAAFALPRTRIVSTSSANVAR